MPEEKENSAPRKKSNTKPYMTRLLQALATVYEDPNAGIQEKLHAIKLSSEILERRPTPRKKTVKEKLIEDALGHKRKPWGGKPIKQDTKKPTSEDVG